MDLSPDQRGTSRRGALRMTAILSIVLIVLLALNASIGFARSGPGAASATTSQIATDNVVSAVAERANPATVTVYNLQQIDHPFSPETGKTLQPVGSGSGYIISLDGYVVTNNHVVEGAAAVQVAFMDGAVVDATLVGTDPFQDVAVLKLDLTGGQAIPGTLEFGDSSDLKTGDTVIAIGSPFGTYANTVTTGIVNATNRSLDTGQGYLLPNLIQHDAEIYPGESGGPLLNTVGEVIGMNVAKAVDRTGGSSSDATSIGFAIESDAVKAVVDELIANGAVARAYLGIRTQFTIDGQVVMSVESGGPAAIGGLKSGDVITAIDGQAIDEIHPFINELVFNHRPGEAVKLTVERGGARITITVTLGERPAGR